MDTTLQRPLLEIRTIELHTPFAWLHAGLADLRAAPLPSLFYGLCFAVIGYGLAYALRYQPQLFAAASAGFMLLGPALAIGLYELSRRREAGLPLRLVPSLTAWRNNFHHLALFSMVLMVVFLVWTRASELSFTLFFSGSSPTLADMVRLIVAPDNVSFLGIWLGIGFFFATLVFLISATTVQMMLDRNTNAISAVLTSLQVVATNPGPMAVWAAIIAWATAAALLMGFIGIIVVGPLLGHASWHAYRSLVDQ
ncbi:MAG: DUF2189 domain-containing protein [Rhodocyclaceae bacterium]|nr:DUF2189 domain-containing protein [Rhodocyclaceae bacterium]MDZ4213621.1 DUF2189 domain-containing protein [Rhodocyclaceae bacterium]